MNIVTHFRGLTSDQRNAFMASFLGWSLDAFDYFILVFVIKYIAQDFRTQVTAVTVAILLTLAMRPIGAFIFGLLADRFGRRPALMIDIIFYSVMELLSGFAPSLASLLVLRALFGIAMGGEWGVGASLAMESIPEQSRGFFSGLLQSGYVVGYLLAAIVFAVAFPFVGWRGMFFIGVIPALLVVFLRSKVKESPAWEQSRRHGAHIGEAIRKRFPLFLYLVILMTSINFMSHGTQDLYPTFLQVQHKISPQVAGVMAVIYNIGALIGCIVFGTFSQRIGRRKAIIIAQVLALLITPLWAFSSTLFLLTLGAFLMQFMIQGAFGVIPAHLNELSPDAVRGTFPGFTYQLGNLLAAANATIQAGIAQYYGGNYGLALALVTGIFLVATIILTAVGKEAKDVQFGTGSVEPVAISA
ncbi:MAG TPA: MFS transporter [Ktedonobacteraceae bacterium]|nr:MFS transporter [Ktedonobacteraceae bacterium]